MAGLNFLGLFLTFDVASGQRTSQVAQWWQRICLPLQEMQHMLVHSLGREDPLEKEMATHSSVLAWEISRGQRSLEGYGPWVAKSQT